MILMYLVIDSIYLGFSKMYIEINNLNQLRMAENPFDVKVNWVLEKVGRSIEGEILSSSRLNAERFLLSISRFTQ